MNRFLLTAISGFFCCLLSAQAPRLCGTDEVMKTWLDANPEIKADFYKRQQEAKSQDSVAALTGYSNYRKTAATVYTVPIVFHILHQYGSENVSDAQIIDAVNILNRDYRKQNADTANIVSPFVAADIYFEFRLATKDPYGKCTNGITRHADIRTDWQGNYSDYAYTWPPSKYLNVYLVRTMGNGAAGYTYLPGSVPSNMDVIVILHNYVGSIGTSNPFTSRALTHEVGHWFNLPHTWGFNNSPGSVCGDEGVSDTPVTKGWLYCPPGPNSAKICTPGVVENYQNYMDYSYCSVMFTPGQAARMTTCINSSTGGRNIIWTNSNLTSTGVLSPLSNCAPIADFNTNTAVTCINTPVNFIDRSYNGTPTSWQWKFPGGTPAASAAQNNTVSFGSSGTQTVSLKVANSTGADSISKIVLTVLPAKGTGTPNITESFETMTFPNNLWIASVPKYAGGWLQNGSVGATGNKSLFIDNYFDSPGESVWFYTPAYDTLKSPSLTFKLAYSQKASNCNDNLKVYSSSNCGTNWALRYNKTGAALHTCVSGSYTPINSFTPTPLEWRTESVNMPPLNNVSNVVFKFVFTPDSSNPGNNIYIDDINITSTSTPTLSGIEEFSPELASLSVYPNPASGSATVKFTLSEKTNVSIELFECTGKKLRVLADNALDRGDHQYTLSTDGLSKGLYFMRFRFGDALHTKKIAIE